MSLDKQIHVYSFDTSAFYTDEEHEQEKIVNSLTYRKSNLKAEREIISDMVSGAISASIAEKRYRSLYHEFSHLTRACTVLNPLKFQHISRYMTAQNYPC